MSDGVSMELVNLLETKFSQVHSKIDESERRSSESRKEVHKKLEDQGKDLLDIKHRVTAMERDWEDARPTLKEFASIKAQIIGGGKVTRVLWFVGVALIGAAFYIVAKWESIAAAFKALNTK